MSLGILPEWSWLIFAGALLYTHELGHKHVAVKEGNFKKMVLFPHPHVQLTRPFKSKWSYLSGVWGSLLSFPVFLLTPLPLYSFPLFILAAAMFDYIPLIWYSKVKEQ